MMDRYTEEHLRKRLKGAERWHIGLAIALLATIFLWIPHEQRKAYDRGFCMALADGDPQASRALPGVTWMTGPEKKMMATVAFAKIKGTLAWPEGQCVEDNPYDRYLMPDEHAAWMEAFQDAYRREAAERNRQMGYRPDALLTIDEEHDLDAEAEEAMRHRIATCQHQWDEVPTFSGRRFRACPRCGEEHPDDKE